MNYPVVNTKLKEYGVVKQDVHDAYFGRFRGEYEDIGSFNGYWYRSAEIGGSVVCTYRECAEGIQYDIIIPEKMTGDDPENQFMPPAIIGSVEELEELVLSVVVQLRMLGVDLDK